MDALDAQAVRRWVALAARDLNRHQDEINELNVYPIPDRDTGTNMAMTMQAAADVAATGGPTDALADGAGPALALMANGAILGARGNSGVILAELLRGLSDSTGAGSSSIGGKALAAGLGHAVSCAYAAVGDPTEGTILSVARAAADEAAEAGEELSSVANAAFAGATSALVRTTDQLDVLRAAGVVDAGGRGLVLVLDALVRTIDGQSDDESFDVSHPEVSQPDASRSGVAQPVVDNGHSSPVPAAQASTGLGSIHHVAGDRESFAYEVQYLLEAEDSAVLALRAQLDGLGDSVVVVGTGSGLWNVHIHVDDVGGAIEAGIRAGRPYQIQVTRFADQIARARPSVRPGVAIVAIAPGHGLAEVFRREGVHVVESRDIGSASADEVLAAVRATGAGSVVLLPNAQAVGAVAELAATRARDEGIVIAVVPTRSPVQGLAAVAVHDPNRRFEDDVIHMTESAAGTRWAEVAVAEREALTSAGRCQAGDVLGLIAGEVVAIGSDIVLVGQFVIDRLLGVGGELVTVLLGAQAPPGAGIAIGAHLARTAAHVEYDVLPSGQPGQPLLIGVE
jgi:uncharacterized protein